MNDRRRWYGRLLSVVVMAALLLVPRMAAAEEAGLRQDGKPDPTVKPFTNLAATDSSDFVHFDNEDAGVSLDYPKDWFAKASSPLGMVTGVAVSSREPSDEKKSFRFSTSANPGSQSAMFDSEGANFGITNMGPHRDMLPMDVFGYPGASKMYSEYFYEGEVLQEPTSILVNGKNAAILAVRGENEAGVSLTLTLISLIDGDNQAMIMAHFPTEREAELAPALKAILNSVSLSERQAERTRRELASSEMAMKDPKRERPDEAGPPPELEIELTARLHDDDVSRATWTHLVKNPGDKKLSVTCTFIEETMLKVWPGGDSLSKSSSMKSPMREPIMLEPGETHVLGSADALLEDDRIPDGVKKMMRSIGGSLGSVKLLDDDILSFVQQGSIRLGIEGTLYFDDEAGHPFSVQFDEETTLQLADPGLEVKTATAPRIRSITIGFNRPSRLKPEEVRELDTFMEIAFDNTHAAPLDVVGFEGKFLNGSIRPTLSKKENIKRFDIWLVDNDTMIDLLTGALTEVPVKGTMGLLIKERGWSPALFSIAFETTVTLEKDSGTSTDVEQTLRYSK